MEGRIQEEVNGMGVCIPSYMNDLHSGLYERRLAGSEIDRRERMQDLVVPVCKTVGEVARENALPVATDK